MGQFGGFAKLGSGSRQAANLVSSSALVPIAPYASSVSAHLARSAVGDYYNSQSTTSGRPVTPTRSRTRGGRRTHT